MQAVEIAVTDQSPGYSKEKVRNCFAFSHDEKGWHGNGAEDLPDDHIEAHGGQFSQENSPDRGCIGTFHPSGEPPEK
jgi:hypothetical protein